MNQDEPRFCHVLYYALKEIDETQTQEKSFWEVHPEHFDKHRKEHIEYLETHPGEGRKPLNENPFWMNRKAGSKLEHQIKHLLDRELSDEEKNTAETLTSNIFGIHNSIPAIYEQVQIWMGMYRTVGGIFGAFLSGPVVEVSSGYFDSLPAFPAFATAVAAGVMAGDVFGRVVRKYANVWKINQEQLIEQAKYVDKEYERLFE